MNKNSNITWTWSLKSKLPASCQHIKKSEISSKALTGSENIEIDWKNAHKGGYKSSGIIYL